LLLLLCAVHAEQLWFELFTHAGGACWTLSAPVPDAFRDAATLLADTARVGVLDCSRRMASGRSIVQSLRLETNVKPTVFVVSNGNRPQQLMPARFTTLGAGAAATAGKQAAVLDETKLVGLVKQSTKPEVVVAKSNATIAEDCLRNPHRACLLVSLDTKPSKRDKAVLQALARKYRGVQVVAVNRRQYLVVHEHLDLAAPSEEMSAPHPRAIVLKPRLLNALSESLAYLHSWEQQAHTIAAAFGHGYVPRAAQCWHVGSVACGSEGGARACRSPTPATWSTGCRAVRSCGAHPVEPATLIVVCCL